MQTLPPSSSIATKPINARPSSTTPSAASAKLQVRHLGLVDYTAAWRAMQDFTAQRGPGTADEIWLLEHPSVFTQGQAGKAEHLLMTGDIPVVQVDRGGQVTYHGPGQLVAYLLIDLKRRQLGVRELVTVIEQSIVAVLACFELSASPRPDAPGVYMLDPVTQMPAAKIAQLGLRVRRGCSFHGLSINVDMEMEPFERINPCGHVGMEVTSMALQNLQQGQAATITPAAAPIMAVLSQLLLDELCAKLGYTERLENNDGQLPVITTG